MSQYIVPAGSPCEFSHDCVCAQVAVDQGQGRPKQKCPLANGNLVSYDYGCSYLRVQIETLRDRGYTFY